MPVLLMSEPLMCAGVSSLLTYLINENLIGYNTDIVMWFTQMKNQRTVMATILTDKGNILLFYYSSNIKIVQGQKQHFLLYWRARSHMVTVVTHSLYLSNLLHPYVCCHEAKLLSFSLQPQ